MGIRETIWGVIVISENYLSLFVNFVLLVTINFLRYSDGFS